MSQASSWAARRPLLLLCGLFLLTLALRLLSVYPPTLRHDPATIALQAFRILDGERPIFWSGQAWMGAAGTYVEALLFRVFGANSLVMSLYAWALSGIWILLSLALAWRLYGPRVALGAAALWLVPTPALLYWSSQARNDFQVYFIATPLILLLTHELILRARERRGIAARSLLLGFVCGFSFWQNMGIGPCLVVTFAVLALHLGRLFWQRFVWLYAPAWLLGCSPMLHYNLTVDLAARGHGSFTAPRVIGETAVMLFTNALPYFWGMPPEERPAGLWGAVQLLFLAWTVALFGVYVFTVWRAWRRREDLLADQLVLGLVLFQLFVPLVTQYGRSFATRGNPILYITNLYTLAFTVPAVVFLRLPGAWRLFACLPFLVYAGNNIKNSSSRPQIFLTALQERGAAAIHRFPDPGNPLIRFLQSQGLTQGYSEPERLDLKLAGLHIVEFSRPYQDRVVEYSLRTDAARDVFWLGDPEPPEGFRMVGAKYEFDPLGVYYRFRRDTGAESLVEGGAVTVSHDTAGAAALTDRRADTVWRLASPIPEAWLRFDFPQEERVDRITLLPEDHQSLPGHIIVQRSRDGAAWETIDEWRQANVFFWSVRHPFLKIVKPRCELVLSRPAPARHLRLLFPSQRGSASLREVYLHRVEASGDAAAALDEEVAAISRQLAPLRRTHQVVGDHYFMSFYKLAGFDVEFIPNRAVNNSGRRNPFLFAPLPVDFSRPLALIVPKSHSASVALRLAQGGVPAERREHARHDLYFTAPVQNGPPLYWSGLDLLRLGPDR